MSAYIVQDYKCVSNTTVYGLDESIKRAKYPKSVNIDNLNNELTKGIKALAQSEKGEGHDNWLNGVVVQFDLTFTVKAWTEEERYHFIDFISSQSTMHKITEFDLDKAYIEYVDPRIITIMKEKVDQYNNLLQERDRLGKDISEYDSKRLKNLLTQKYLEILYSNPCGFKLTAGMTTNYRQLKTIYAQRKTHRLPEWRTFCEWIETLPMAKELIIGGDE